MSDVQTEPDAPETPQEGNEGTDQGEQEPFDAERAKAKISKANNEAKQLRDRLKAAEAKASEYDKLKDAEKSESERLAEKSAQLEERATKAEMKALRYEVAGSKGLSARQAKYLTGSTQEELEARADEILEDFPEADDGPTHPRRPTEHLRGGGAPTSDHDDTDPRKLADRMGRL